MNIFVGMILFVIGIFSTHTPPTSPVNQYDHFFYNTPWNTQATAFTLEFFWGGACQLSYRQFIDEERLYVALPGPDYQSSHSGTCGKCMRVESIHASIEVINVDECSGCVQSSVGPNFGTVDLSANAFAIIANITDEYKEWRDTFDDWMTNTWIPGHPSGEMPQEGVDYNHWPAGPGIFDIKITPVPCSMFDNVNISLRIKHKGSDYIELVVIKSTRTIGSIKLYAGDGDHEFELKNSAVNNVWTNSGNGVQFDTYNDVISLEFFPLFDPSLSVLVENIQLPSGTVEAIDDVDYIDLGFQFPSNGIKLSFSVLFTFLFSFFFLL